jgi:hypothetical protein
MTAAMGRAKKAPMNPDRAPGHRRRERHPGVQLHGLVAQPGAEHVVLQLLVGQDLDQHQHRRREADRGQGHQHRHRPRDSG